RDVPILIVVGDQDRLTPPAHSAELARELPGAELLVVPGAGHIVILESPDVVDETLVAFLRRVPARTGRSRRSAST
ncbi:MAG: alpha/beta fold hydrolase, partial [Mycobacteriales bacterium]